MYPNYEAHLPQLLKPAGHNKSVSVLKWRSCVPQLTPDADKSINKYLKSLLARHVKMDKYQNKNEVFGFFQIYLFLEVRDSLFTS